MAWPAISIARAAYGDHPRGDAPLWRAGGFELLDLLANARYATTATFAAAAAAMLVSTILGALPTAALVASIAYSTRDLKAPPLRDVAARAVRAFGPMLVVLAVGAVVEGLLLGLGAIAGAIAGSALEHRAGEARAEQVGWIVFALFTLGGAFVGVTCDLARAAVVRFRVRGLAALRLGVNAVRRAPAVAFWSWAWRAIAGLALVGVGALVSDRLGGRGGAALVALGGLHQVVVVTRLALRASWLAKALRTVDGAHRVVRQDARAEADASSARSGAPSGPTS